MLLSIDHDLAITFFMLFTFYFLLLLCFLFFFFFLLVFFLWILRKWFRNSIPPFYSLYLCAHILVVLLIGCHHQMSDVCCCHCFKWMNLIILMLFSLLMSYDVWFQLLLLLSFHIVVAYLGVCYTAFPSFFSDKEISFKHRTY